MHSWIYKAAVESPPNHKPKKLKRPDHTTTHDQPNTTTKNHSFQQKRTLK